MSATCRCAATRCAPRRCRPSPSPTSTRHCSWRATCRPTIPTCWPTGASAAPTTGPRPAGLPRDHRRLLRHAGAAGAEAGARSMPVALDLPAAYFDGPFQDFQYKLRMTHYPHQAGPRRRRVRHRAAHRHQLPHPARAQRGARPLDPHAERQVDRRAGHPGRLCRERRAVAAALDQRLSSSPRRTARSTAAAASATRWPSSATATSTGRSPPCRPASARTSRPSIRRPTTPTTWSSTRSGPTTC